MWQSASLDPCTAELSVQSFKSSRGNKSLGNICTMDWRPLQIISINQTRLLDSKHRIALRNVMAKKPATQTASTPPKPLKQTNSSQPASKSTPSLSSKPSPQQVALHVWNEYLQNTPARTFLLDAFMVFLVLIGGIQFLYAVLFGNYVCFCYLNGWLPKMKRTDFVCSLSMLFYPASRLRSVNSSSQPPYECRHRKDYHLPRLLTPKRPLRKRLTTQAGKRWRRTDV